MWIEYVTSLWENENCRQRALDRMLEEAKSQPHNMSDINALDQKNGESY